MESSLGVAGAIVCVREKQTTPGGISRIIYLKWQRRFSEPKHQMRTASRRPPPRRLALFNSFFNSFFFFFLLPFLFAHPTQRPNQHALFRFRSRASPPPLGHCHQHLPHNTCTRIRPPSPQYQVLMAIACPSYVDYLNSRHSCLSSTIFPLPHVSSPSSSHNSASPSMSSTSKTASLRSNTQATLRPVLPFSASETSPLIHPASTYDRLIGMRTEAICKQHVPQKSERLSSLPVFSYLTNFPFFHGVFNQLLPRKLVHGADGLQLLVMQIGKSNS